MKKVCFSTVIVSSFLIFNSQAQDTPGVNIGNSGAQQPKGVTPSGQFDFQTDLFTGRFGYSVPLEVAPGRHGSQPKIALRYNSSGENTWCGTGWDLDLGYIQRDTKKGVPVKWSSPNSLSQYDDAKGFIFSLNGQSANLINVTNNEYRAEIEGGFLRFILLTNGNKWQVIDKSGNQYFFGQTNLTRMSNSKAGWSSNATSGTFRWALDQVQTVNGDTTAITYTNITGALYPALFSYNGHTNSLTNSCTVQFLLATRSDTNISLKSGYRVDQTKRLDAIVHKVSSQLVWSNKLTYATSPSTQRSLLSSVTLYGTSGTTNLPPISFDYSEQNYGFQSAVNWTNLFRPSSGDVTFYALSGSAVDLLDMDGDGLPDRLIQPLVPPYTNWWVQKNTGGGFATQIPWGPLGFQTYSNLTTSNSVYWTSLQSSHGRMVDIDGDGKPDRVTDPFESYQGGGVSNILKTNFVRLHVELNNSTNLLSAISWSNVVDQYIRSNTNDPISETTDFRAVENISFVKMLDMNGDGLPDRVMRKRYQPYTNYVVQFNTGTNFSSANIFGGISAQSLTNDPGWTAFDTSLVYLIDINGDGLPDRVMPPRDTNTFNGQLVGIKFTNFVVELNNGYGFEPAMNWSGVDPQFNAPGTGTTTDYSYIETSDGMVGFRDINGDGLPDRIMRKYNPPYTNWLVQVNTGNGFASVINWPSLGSQGQTNSTDWTGIQTANTILMDINGDGLVDRVEAKYNPTLSDNYLLVELSKGPFPDLLTVVSNGIGGKIDAAYKVSTQYDNHETTNSTSRQLLPFPIYTVSSVSVSDGFYPSNTTTYLYEGGFWDATRREFNGFAKVKVTDPLGLTNIHWFHQAGGRDNSAFGEYQDAGDAIGKKGMPFRIETIGTNGVLYKLELNKVEDAMLAGDRHFAFVSQSLSLDYPGSTNAYRATAQQFNYNLTTGNLTNQIHFGEVTNVVFATNGFSDVGSDSVYQFTTFAALSNTNILDKPERSTLTDDAGGTTLLKESLFSYDGASGNLMAQRDRICAGSYATNSYSYNGYANKDSETNSAGIVTQTTYDSATQTFPIQQTVGGSFTSTFNFDARSGKLFSSTDAKGLVASNAYDAFLRITTNWISTTPNGAANLWIASSQYGLGGIVSGVSKNFIHVQKNDGVDSANGHETWSYSDGLGRQIQTRVESETNGFRVSDVIYDKRGGVRLDTLPYFSSGTNYTAPTTNKLGALHDYDPIARPTVITPAVNGTFSSGLLTTTSATSGDTGSPVGSLTLAYNEGNNPWTMVRTDEENKIHKYLLDAFGRTNQIIEPGNYTTTLRYDKRDYLTNTVDNAGNSIEYAYNDLGQMVAMADPDMGVWKYKRDVAGRVREQTDAKNQKIIFNYNDPLGRLKSKEVYNYTGAFAYAVTNFYDSSDDGNFTVYAGQLFKVVDNEGTEKNSYDVRGRTLKTARTLTKNGQTYTNQFTFDDADRVQTTVYPNNGPTLTNIYDLGGNLSQVKQVGGSNTVFYTARGFDAQGQLLGVNFGNNTITTNDYYANSKRLKGVATAKSGSTNVQSLGYSYDKVSNLKGIADTVYSSSASAALTNLVYDDLHRLTSLMRPAISQTTTFSFSSIGNLTVNGEAGAGTYNYGTRMPHAVKSANGKNYAYDGNGNMLVRGMQRLDYDPENRLSLVTSTNSTTIFGYADSGARLWKQTGTNLQVWIGDIYEEKKGQVLFHVSANGKSVCTFDSTGTNVFEYYHSDHLRSTSVLTDKNGSRVQHHEYSAFGRDRFTESTTAFSLSRRYTSQVLDEDTGLYFYGARYYDPELARFIQPDSMIPDLGNPQSYNRYSYTLNNPLKYTDPTGHESYLEGVGNVYLGYYDTGVSAVRGTVNMVAHPIQTAQGIGSAVAHPIDTGTAIVNSTVETWNSGSRGKGQVVANILLAVGTAVAPGAQAGSVSKVAQVANVTSKAEEVAQAAQKVGAVAEKAGNVAHNAADLIKLNKSLASQQQLGEAGQIMAGSGSRVPFRSASRMAEKYGGDASDWAKMKSSSYKASDGTKLRTHWVENTKTQQRAEFKTKIGEAAEK